MVNDFIVFLFISLLERDGLQRFELVWVCKILRRYFNKCSVLLLFIKVKVFLIYRICFNFKIKDQKDLFAAFIDYASAMKDRSMFYKYVKGAADEIDSESYTLYGAFAIMAFMDNNVSGEHLLKDASKWFSALSILE